MLNSKVMRILVTGGAGFIGSHLCKKLVTKGHEVICLDNFFTGRKDNVADLQKNPKFQMIYQDITNPICLEVDQIYNLACPASPVHYQYDPIKTVKTSVLGAINVLELAKSVKARVLQASTSEVYGDPAIHPQPETYWGNVNPVGPRSCYDEGKRCAETLFFDYHRKYKVDSKVVRIFNTYGPFMRRDDGRVVSNFITQALENKPITIYGNGDQTRSFCYIDDLVEGLIAIMNSPDDFIGPINLGNPGEFTILELAETIIRQTDSKSEIIFSSLPQDDPKMRRPDISLAKQKLNWQPQISLEEGLQRTIAYFSEHMQLGYVGITHEGSLRYAKDS